MPASAVQAWMRQVFGEWGLPERLRVDNGLPWGSCADLPPALALWWLGLGIRVIWNHPHSPKENGFVERANGLVGQWGEPSSCGSFEQWSERIAWLVKVQREEYPAKAGLSRAAAYPSLSRNPRCYCKAREQAHWELRRVQAYLAGRRWKRQVSKVGQITLYNRVYSVGRAQAGTMVWVGYDAASFSWVIVDERGVELVRYRAREITAERIRQLAVSGRKTARQSKREAWR